MAKIDPSATTDNASEGVPVSPDYVIEAGAGAVVLPYGDLLLQAEYSRNGGDLLLRSPGGETVQITGYFNQEIPPDLFTLAGAKIGAGLAARLAGPQNPGEFAQADGVSELEEEIGSVDSIRGSVTVTRADGTQVVLGEGDPLFQGDTLASGPGSAVGIIFIDKSTMSMAADSRIVLDELVYDPSTLSGSQVFDIVQGAFAFTSGAIGKGDPESVSVNTPVATIGIRGTKYAVSVDAADGATSVTVFEGAVIVANDAGTSLLTTIGESTLISSSTIPPSETFVMPADVQEQTYGDALAFHPPPQAIPGFGEDDASIDDLADGLDEIETAAGPEASTGVFTTETAEELQFDLAANLNTTGTLGNGSEILLEEEEDNGDGGPVEAQPEENTGAGPDEGTGHIFAGPGVTLGVVTGRGDEDTAISIAIDVAAIEETPGYDLEVRIAGIPEGAVLTNSAGETFSGEFSYTLTPEQLAGLTITPDTNSSADIGLTVTAIVSDADGIVAEIVGPVEAEVIIDAVADDPDFAASLGQIDIDLDENPLFSVDLDIQAALTDTNTTNDAGDEISAETLLMNLYGVPDGAILWNDAGPIAVANNAVSLQVDDLAGLKITVPVGTPDFQLTLFAQAHEADFESGAQSYSSPIVELFDVDVLTVDELNAAAALDNLVGEVLDGGDGDDMLVSVGDGDILLGDDGDDALTSNDSDDVLFGEDGDDQLIIDYDSFPTEEGSPVNFGVIDGGQGDDTLSIVSSSADHLSVSGDQFSGVTNIEAIDLTGIDGGADISLSAEDLVSVSGSDDLTILLGENDTVEVDGQQVTETTTFSFDGKEISLIIEQQPPPESIA